jgi:hypothetical protein
MKAFFARLFNLFTIIATIVLFTGVIAIGMKNSGNGDGLAFIIFMAIWFGSIAGLNYLVLGKPTLWNDKQD